MVGPVSKSERASFVRKVKVGVALLVAVSSGLVALQVGATAVQVAGASVGGLVVGAVIARYIVPETPGPADRRRRNRDPADERIGEWESSLTDGDDDDADRRRESESADLRRRE